MTDKDLFTAMNMIKEEYIEESEKSMRIKKKTGNMYFATAAAFILIFAAVALLGNSHSPELPEASQEETSFSVPELSCIYNISSSPVATYKTDVQQYFPERIDEISAESFIPKKLFENGESSFDGTAYFSYEGRLHRIELQKSSSDEYEFRVTLSEYATLSDYLMPEKSETEINGKNVYFYEYTNSSACLLEAEFNSGGVYYTFYVQGDAENAAYLKEIIEKAVFVYTETDGEHLSFMKNLTPKAIPEFKNTKLTEKGIYGDESFGGYVFSEAPSGFMFESGRRYKDYRSDYLSALWCSGLYTLRVQVSYITETDKNRITSVSEKENYDLSLYPIPRAQSVPEELYEIVDDPIFSAEELTLEAVKLRAYETDGDEGVKMMFSVLFGDVLVHISSNGVSPEWLFEAIKSIE